MVADRAHYKKKKKSFHRFLSQSGAEVLNSTNPWELTRFRYDGLTSIVYESRKYDRITMVGDAEKAWLSFLSSNKNWPPAKPVRKQDKKRSVTVQFLIDRDGSDCFFCLEELGEDITTEHLVPFIHKGPDHVSNKALAHRRCNQNAGNLSLMEKLKIREQNLLTKWESELPWQRQVRNLLMKEFSRQ